MPHFLRNPHSVLAALDTRPQDVLEITLPTKALTESWEKVAVLAAKHQIPIHSGTAPTASRSGPRFGAKPKPGRGVSREETSRQGVAEAQVREREPISVEELFSSATSKRNGKGLWLALDCLQDPQNVGAIFRAAAFFGVQGILLTQERSAPLTSVVYDIACGGLEYIPFAIQPNLQRAFEKAKEAGVWILGSSEHSSESHLSIPKDRAWLLVLGNEERGMRRLTQENCDLLCTISGQGKVTSLNVSVAAGILISHFAS